MKARVATILIVALTLVGSTSSAVAEPKEGEGLMIEKLVVLAQSVQGYVANIRRYLHQHPETRWEEDQTLNFVREEVDRIGSGLLQQQLGFAGGYVYDLTVRDDAVDRIVLRADVDALPVTEATGLRFTSAMPGKMHACGHDTHVAMLLGAIKAITKGGVVPRHNLRFVFQRAEENPGTEPLAMSGGAKLVCEGVLKDVNRAYGLHIWPNGVAGTFYSRAGAFLGNSGRLKMVLHGKGGHVAQPHRGDNVLRIWYDVMTAFNTIAARRLPPTEPVTVEPVIAKAGTGSNIMPAEGEFWFGVRTMLPRDEHNAFMAAMEEETRTIVSRYPGASVDFTRILGHPSLQNDEDNFGTVRRILTDAGQPVEVHEPLLGGEDFAHYLDRKHKGVPGSFWLLGAHQEGTGDCHAPTFNPDESVFWNGVLFWLLLATSPDA